MDLIKKFFQVLRDLKDRFFAYEGKIALGSRQKKMIIIGVTGTKGKSTIVSLMSHILNACGLKFGSFSTIESNINGDILSNNSKLTMPGRGAVHFFLRRAYDQGARIGIIEVSSVGLVQHRGDYIEWDIALLTNLQKEHLEIHGGFEKYKEAKGLLFRQLKKYSNKFINNQKILKTSIINFDDENNEYFFRIDADRKIALSIYGKPDVAKINLLNLEFLKPEQVQIAPDGIVIQFEGETYKTHLIGQYNAYNIMFCLALSKVLNLDKENVKKALQTYEGARGRMQFIKTKDNISVVIDYAHTPDSLEEVYKTLKQMGYLKLIGIFGACGSMINPLNTWGIVKSKNGGTRDEWKRPVMGEIADKYCDYIILTNEDPYDEAPYKIIQAINEGIKNQDKVEIILDRREAIRKGIELAKPGTVVVITGKGCEKTIMEKGGIRGYKKVKWEGDYDLALQYLKEAGKTIV